MDPQTKVTVVLAIYCGLRIFLKEVCGDLALIEFRDREFIVDLEDVFPVPLKQITW
jgi:hypothetical protein